MSFTGYLYLVAWRVIFQNDIKILATDTFGLLKSWKVIILPAMGIRHVGLILMNQRVTSVDATKCLKKMKMTNVLVL